MLVRFCKNKKMEKMIAIMLIITMTCANLIFLGKNLITYAFDENLEMQGTSTQSSNVKFDAYFNDNGGENVHSVICDATNNVQKMNLYIAVKKAGYLKEAYVYFRDENNNINTNYNISDEVENEALVQNVNTESKTMSLNYINSGTESVIEMPIKLDLEEITQLNKLNQGTLVTLRGIYVDENGKETEISKTIKLNIGWNLETELNVEQSITKYVPYSYGEQTGLILQVAIKAKQNRDDKVLPVKESQITIKVPEMAEVLPEKVTVLANSTMATNGNKVEFTDDNWTYNEEEKTITITVQGYEEEGYIWSGVGTDEYFVTYVYPKAVYEYALENEVALYCEAEAKMKLYSSEGIIEKNILSSGNIMLSQQIGDIVTYNIEVNEDEISKGRMYANYNSEEKTYDTEYKSTIKLNVSNSELVDGVYVQLPCDNFIDQEEYEYTTKVNGISYTNYKQIVINKAKMQKILGEDGYINIYDSNSNTYVINNETQDIDGNYIIDFEDEIGELTIYSSKPLEDGILEIDTTKTISKDLVYSKEQVQQFKNLKVNVMGYVQYLGKVVPVDQICDIIKLTETETNAKLEISNTSLTSMSDNKNVEIKIIFNNNVETSDLYKNPVFTIKLPNYIEDVEITGGNILSTNGLEIDYVEKNYTDEGMVLKIFTKGAENSFSTGTFTNGTNIVLNTNIKVNMLTPNVSEKIIMIYTNENAIGYSNEENGYGFDSVDVNFIAPEEMVTFNAVLTNSAETISTEGNEQTAKLEILDSSKTATMKISILNKYSNLCNNIRILGRVPFEGNKEITTGEDLGTTFNAKLISRINTNGINAEVYYSENENATEDLANASNGWTIDAESLTNIKSYLIILPDYEMKPGEMLEFSYNCQIPEQLEHNESAYGTYVVYFDSVSEYIEPNAIEAVKVGLTTGIGANIETSTKATYQGENLTADKSVQEYQYITYQTTVKNTGTIDATGVKLTNQIKNATIEKAEGATISSNMLLWDLGEIKAGQTKTVEYVVRVNEISSIVIDGMYSKDVSDNNGNVVTKYYIVDASGNEQEINPEDYYRVNNSVKLVAQNFDGTLEDTIENTIKKAKVKISITSTVPQETVYTKGSKITYSITIQNISGNPINNAKLQLYLPEGLTFVSIDKANYDENTRMISYDIENLQDRESISLVLITNATIGDNDGRLEPIVQAKVVVENSESYISNEYKMVIIGPIINIEHTADITNNSYLKENNKITFSVKVKNSGEDIAKQLRIDEVFPSELKLVEYECKVGTKTYKLRKGDEGYYTYVEIKPGEEAIINITLKGVLSKNVDEKTVEVYAKASSTYMQDKLSNKLTYIIEKSDTQPEPDNPDNPTEQTYKITGIAWLDENEDGKKDTNEKLLEGIDVLLIDANTGVIVTDRTNGSIKQTKTSSNGTYTFSNLTKGKYMVIFQYNSAYYDITEYKKAGATDDVTSKAIQSKINKDGKLVIAGVTDAINLTNASKANINIGLIIKQKFDLSLEKTITKVMIQNSSGTSIYDFANTKLAKVEIPGKYLSNSKVYIEYRIKVKNEGEVAGYVRKIVDYMSKDFEFDQDSNLTWYKGADGNLYNGSLAETLINPGEEKELVLVLRKTMTEDNTGITTNKAEILDAYNDQNLEDQDSIPGNMAQEEDDLDYADILISVKTGQMALYISITLISITILVMGIYLINKKVLKGGKI